MAPLLNRRTLLRAAAAVTLSTSPLARALASDARSLSFRHTHTGEALSLVYFRDGGYVPASLAQVDRFLRDFRTGEIHPIDPQLLDILASLHAGCDTAGAYEVVSGYRSPRTNAALRRRSSGVAEHSMHLEGRAIDVRLTGVATAALRERALDLNRGGVGYYAASDFVHLDTGRVRHW
jgi:uncharacterized protein YcbK (DUF882 family)